MLNMLEHFDIGSLQPNSAEHLHLFIEAKKLAFEDRAVYYADMDFAKVPLQQLISKDYAAERAKLIDPKRAAQQVQLRPAQGLLRHDLPDRRRQGRQHGLADPEHLSTAGAPAMSRTAWASACRIAACSSRSTRTTSTASSRTSARSTRSSPRSSRRTAGPSSPSASWAAISSPRATSRS